MLKEYPTSRLNRNTRSAKNVQEIVKDDLMALADAVGVSVSRISTEVGE